jgi:hypothetical protein
MKHDRSPKARGTHFFGGTFAVLAGVAALFAAAGPAACSSDSGAASTTTTGTTTATNDAGAGGHVCPGVVVNGKCLEPCSPDKCVAGNICVGNACVLPCKSLLDCALDGTQDCAAAKEDVTNADVTACLPNGKVGGKSCPLGTECKGEAACPDGTRCDPAQCGGQPASCTLDQDACGADAKCTTGKCPDGSACTVFKCPVEQCQALACHSAGSGDADAYCTHADCTQDADCPGGFYCGVQKDPHDICGAKCANGTCDSGPNKGGQCQKDGDCQKGNNATCGKTTDPCIAPADFAKNGATYFEAPLCLERKVCLKRGECAPCDSDLDCSSLPAQKCVQIGAVKNCARTCSTAKDCEADFKCSGGACVPRSGACRGSKFCEHCVDDRDCADGASCVDASGGQKACIKVPIDTKCTTDTDCPLSPSGKHGACLSETQNLQPTDPAYHYCYLPWNNAQSKFECWY